MILFAGGGTGGHIYPNVAVVERMQAMDVSVRPHFVISNRAVDAAILDKLGHDYTAIPMQPFAAHPLRAAKMLASWWGSRAILKRLLEQHRVAAVVSTGGFVSVPAMGVGAAAGLPTVLVNLDAVPGKANRWSARSASALFSAFEVDAVLGWQYERVGLPLRSAAVGPEDRGEAKTQFGIDAELPVLLVVGGSQGAQSLNHMMVQLAADAEVRASLKPWHVLHIAGAGNESEATACYEAAGLSATVLGFCDRMGAAWRAADLAICRAGAGSVAEAWTNRAPSLFFPYPGHRDQHQRLNAEPMAAAGGAMLFVDQIDPQANVAAVRGELLTLLSDATKRQAMRDALDAATLADGAQVIATYLTELLRREPMSGIRRN